jgi:GPH family glycoside/pentoside/hexuronide:cation symporter
MLADVVDDHAVRTSHRAEGLFFAANSVLSKCVAGLGTLISGLMLNWAHFPVNAKPGHVDPALMHQLGLVYIPIGVLLNVLSLVCLSFFSINREQHEENLSLLESAALAEAATVETSEHPQPLIPSIGKRPSVAADGKGSAAMLH